MELEDAPELDPDLFPELVPEMAPEFEPQQSLLHWYVTSMGSVSIALLFAAMLAAIILILVLWIRGRGVSVPAAILLLMPLPLVVGSFALIDSTVRALDIASNNGPGKAVREAFSHGFTTAMSSTCCFFPVLMLGTIALLTLGIRKQPPAK